MRGDANLLTREDDASLAAISDALASGITALEQAVEFIVATYASDVRKASVGAVPLLELLGIVAGGWQMARAARISRQRLREGTDDAGFYTAKLHTARFYADHVLSRVQGLAHAAVHGAEAALAITDDML
jgi:acyl-CoA dehydrogenase